MLARTPAALEVPAMITQFCASAGEVVAPASQREASPGGRVRPVPLQGRAIGERLAPAAASLVPPSGPAPRAAGREGVAAAAGCPHGLHPSPSRHDAGRGKVGKGVVDHFGFWIAEFGL